MLCTPLFQVPDEQSALRLHGYLAQHGRPPVPAEEDSYSGSQAIALQDLRFEATKFVPADAGVWTPLEQARLQRDLRAQRERDGGNGGAKAVGGEPPLDYALDTIPYRLAAGGTVLDGLGHAAAVGAAWLGLTVLFVFLFCAAAARRAVGVDRGRAGVASSRCSRSSAAASTRTRCCTRARRRSSSCSRAPSAAGGLTAPAVARRAAMAAGLLTKFNDGARAGASSGCS